MTTIENLKSTLGSGKWMMQNENAIRNLLPDTWTLMDNVNILRIGFGLKVLGVD